MQVATLDAGCPLCDSDAPRTPIAQSPDFEYRTTGEQEFRFQRCDGCGVVMLDPRPVDDAIAGLYPPNYEPYRFDTLPALIRWARDLVQRRKVDLITRHAPVGSTIVDVGCGGGALLRLVRARTGDRYRLIGWDYPGPHLEQLATDGFDVIAAPISPGHVPDQVDLFILNQVIEHVPHPDRLLAMLAGATRPGGRIIIETPHTGGLDARIFHRRHWGGYHTPRHMVLFDQRNLSSLVERAGYRPLEAARLSSPAFWVQSLHHALSETSLATLAGLCTLRNVPLTMFFAALDTITAVAAPTSNQRLVAERR